MLIPTDTAAKVGANGAIALLKFVLIVALVGLLVYTVKTIYDDQVEVRERIVAETVAKAAAEAEVRTQTIIIKAQKERAAALAEELRLAREAVADLNQTFGVIKKDQQKLLGQVKGVASDLETKPAPEVEADANALMASVNQQLEELYQ